MRFKKKRMKFSIFFALYKVVLEFGDVYKAVIAGDFFLASNLYILCNGDDEFPAFVSNEYFLLHSFFPIELLPNLASLLKFSNLHPF